jgi:hypothetical protein
MSLVGHQRRFTRKPRASASRPIADISLRRIVRRPNRLTRDEARRIAANPPSCPTYSSGGSDDQCVTAMPLRLPNAWSATLSRLRYRSSRSIYRIIIAKTMMRIGTPIATAQIVRRLLSVRIWCSTPPRSQPRSSSYPLDWPRDFFEDGRRGRTSC